MQAERVCVSSPPAQPLSDAELDHVDGGILWLVPVIPAAVIAMRLAVLAATAED